MSTKKVCRIFRNDDGWFVGTPYNGWHLKFTPDPESPDQLHAKKGRPDGVWDSVVQFGHAMQEGDGAVIAALGNPVIIDIPVPAEGAVGAVNAMFAENEIMEVEEAIVANLGGPIIRFMRAVGTAVSDFLAGLIGAEELKAKKDDGHDNANDESIHVEGNTSAFIIEVDNRTTAKTFSLLELHIQENVLIQTSQTPGSELGLMGSQTLAYGYSSVTKVGNAESNCWVKWELADKSWWFGIEIHVPAKGLGIGTWPYYEVSSANADGHSGGWWRPDAHASNPSTITPDKFADKEKFEVAILPTSTGSTLSLAVTIKDI